MKRKRSIFQSFGLAMACAALCGMTMAPSMAAASEAQVATSKDETVHVSTSADGTVLKTSVTEVLKNGAEAQSLSDVSSLQNIKADDEQSYTTSEGGITWDAQGKDVTYTGDTGASAPVAIRITYTLDGQPVSAEQLAGKSGTVSIRYDYDNLSSTTAVVRGASQTVYTPFTCITALMLDTSSFKNVSVENGKIVEDGSDSVVIGYAMPGLKQSLGSMASDADIPDHFTVTANVTDFQLKSSMTIVTAGLMSDLDTESMSISGLDDADALTDAMSTLVAGSGTLTDGIVTLKDGIAQAGEGTGTLAEGADALSAGLYVLLNGDGETEGLNGAIDSSSQLVDAISQVSQAAAQLSDEEQGLPAAASALEQAAADPQSFATAKALLATYQETMSEEDFAVLDAALDAAIMQSATVGSVSPGITASAEGSKQLSSTLAAIAQQSEALPYGISAAADAVGQLYYGSVALSDGATELTDAMNQLKAGAEAAAQGSDALTQGMTTFNDEGVAKLVETLQNDFGGTMDRMNALSSAAKAYSNFAGISPGTTGSVKFVFETAAITTS